MRPWCFADYANTKRIILFLSLKIRNAFSCNAYTWTVEKICVIRRTKEEEKKQIIDWSRRCIYICMQWRSMLRGRHNTNVFFYFYLFHGRTIFIINKTCSDIRSFYLCSIFIYRDAGVRYGVALPNGCFTFQPDPAGAFMLKDTYSHRHKKEERKMKLRFKQRMS